MSNRRIIAEIKKYHKNHDKLKKQGLTIIPNKEKLNEFIVEMFDFGDCKISKSMKKFNIKSIKFHIIIPEQYPSRPPFVRVISPIFKAGSGFVMGGGSLCVDVLTYEGWSCVYTIQTLMMAIKSLMMTDTNTAVIVKVAEYSLENAKKSYAFTTKWHKWGKSKS